MLPPGFRAGWTCQKVRYRRKTSAGTSVNSLEEVRHLAEWDQTLTLLLFEDEEVLGHKGS